MIPTPGGRGRTGVEQKQICRGRLSAAVLDLFCIRGGAGLYRASSEDITLDRQHHESRMFGRCCVRLHFLLTPNREVENVVLDSLLDTFDKRIHITTAAHKL